MRLTDYANNIMQGEVDGEITQENVIEALSLNPVEQKQVEALYAVLNEINAEDDNVLAEIDFAKGTGQFSVRITDKRFKTEFGQPYVTYTDLQIRSNSYSVDQELPCEVVSEKDWVLAAHLKFMDPYLGDEEVDLTATAIYGEGQMTVSAGYESFKEWLGLSHANALMVMSRKKIVQEELGLTGGRK